MTIATDVRQSLPTGTWQLDPVHSSVGFEVSYMVGAFRGHFRDVSATFDARDDSAALKGTARVASVDVKDENLAAHLQSPEFFDAEAHPELRFESTDVSRRDREIVVRGEITIKGITRPVELTGKITDPIVDPYGRERIGLNVATTIDRTEFDLNWNAPLPTGEPALANEVTLVAELYFVKEG